MPAKASCEIKTRTVHQPQKNGDIYVIERKTQYDPIKKYNVVLSSRIIGKIPKGETKIVPTRPKKRSGEKVLNSNASEPIIKATRRKVGMMDIIDHIGKDSGIDNAIYSATDRGTAQKFFPLPDICWQQTVRVFRESRPGSLLILFHMKMDFQRISTMISLRTSDVMSL